MHVQNRAIGIFQGEISIGFFAPEKMSVQESYRAFRRAPGENTETILPSMERIPPLQSNEVLICIHAVSLNYRDVGMLCYYNVPLRCSNGRPILSKSIKLQIIDHRQ